MVGPVQRAVAVRRRQQLFHQPGHRLRQADEDQAHHEVEAQVEQHRERGRVLHQRLHPLEPQRDQPGGDQHAHHFEEQVAHRNPPGTDARARRGDHGHQPAAQVGPQHQTERHVQPHHLQRQGGGEQDHGQAGVGQHRQRGAHQDFQQPVAAERLQHQLHRRVLRQLVGGAGHQLQRQQHQAQTDEDASDVAGDRALARDEQRHAGEDAQRREPGQVEGKHHRHHAGADVRAQHHGQGGGQRDQAAAHEGAGDQRGGGAGLHQGRDRQAGERGREAVAHAGGEYLAQVAAEDAQHPAAHQVRPPHQQGHGGQKIQQMSHEHQNYTRPRGRALARLGPATRPQVPRVCCGGLSGRAARAGSRRGSGRRHRWRCPRRRR